jgi:D-sedoheptulose 7-phosphate isomerase
MESWRDYVGALTAGLDGLTVTTLGGAPLTLAEGFDRWLRLTREAQQAGRMLYFIGNGGSAMIAGHMAADACKNGGLRAMAFNDASLLTAVGNDVAFEDIFALPLTRLAQRGDLLVAISSSGESPNVLRALEAARALEVGAVTLSGKSAGNRVRTLGDVNFHVPAGRYGWVESAHQLIVHYWFDQYLNLYGKGAV